jgi:hypothetical protein
MYAKGEIMLIQKTTRFEHTNWMKLELIKEDTGIPISKMINEAIEDYLEKKTISPEEVPSIPNKDITAPEYDKVTEGYNPDDKTKPTPEARRNTFTVGDDDPNMDIIEPKYDKVTH